jgi:general secretion pathway protein D/MSHA biogenesis protein MshL
MRGMLLLFLIIGFMTGCAASKRSLSNTPQAEPQADQGIEDANASSQAEEQSGPYSIPASSRPSVSWQPSFTVEDIQIKESKLGLPELKVGANINTKSGKVVLREVIKAMAGLKGMSVSWTNDVDQSAMVDVNIVNADEDFWIALTNILRQLDYFFEFKENTIIVKYKDTKRFYLSMPFLTGSYLSEVGGNMLGGQKESKGVKAVVNIKHEDDNIDLWDTIQQNLEKILKFAGKQTTEVALSPSEESQIQQRCMQQFARDPAMRTVCIQTDRESVLSGRSDRGDSEGAANDSQTRGDMGKFFYLIDKPLGIVTVTAPRSILAHVEIYFEALKKEFSRQVIIEAKIIEVYLDNSSQMGIDWSNLLKDSSFRAKVTFGDNGRIYPGDGIKFISGLNLFREEFSIFLNFLEEYGSVKVLSNPKLTLLNGQPAMISVGENVTYLAGIKISYETSGEGPTSTTRAIYTSETDSVLSGVGFGVMANISSDDEVVLHITPVTTKLEEPILYESLGEYGDKVGLPRTRVRELTTIAKIKNGQYLIIGGLIDEIKGSEGNKVPLLGDLPIIGYVFKNTKDYTTKRELIILLRPQIVDI